ncbi:hypothetical protein BDQ17DRAFT_1504500 [Cyathus striatus]|nr:hypothetical protein BDQ17DRAFT_1504500 [Cyathus striatus]
MLSDNQIQAIVSAKAALLAVGLDPDVLDNIAHLTPASHIDTNSLGSTLSNEVSTSMTTPSPVLQCPSAVAFNGIDKKYHPATNLKINRLLILDYLLDYPPCAIEEYLEPALTPEGAVGHRFTIDPNNFYHPKFNIQYLFGNRHGGVDNVYCGELLLHAELGKPVLCNKLYITCRGLKVCEHYSESINSPSSHILTAEQHVFEKMLSFFCAVQEKGCSFDHIDFLEYSGDSDSDDNDDIENILDPKIASKHQKHPHASKICHGKMIFSYKYNQPHLQSKPIGIVTQVEDYILGYCIAYRMNVK